MYTNPYHGTQTGIPIPHKADTDKVAKKDMQDTAMKLVKLKHIRLEF